MLIQDVNPSFIEEQLEMKGVGSRVYVWGL